jgi:RNase P subunit RPR2
MKNESVRIMCPNLTCRKILSVPVQARGRTVRCRSCGTNIRVPFAAETSQINTTKPPESKSA